MTKRETKWLVEEFPKYMGLTLKGAVKDAYEKAEKLLFNLPETWVRDCTCEYGYLFNRVNTKYEEFLKSYNEQKNTTGENL